MLYWNLNYAETFVQQVKINLQSISNVAGGRQGHNCKRRATTTVIEGMTVFSNLHVQHDFFFFKALFFSLSRGKISQFWKEFENGKGESLRNRLG